MAFPPRVLHLVYYRFLVTMVSATPVLYLAFLSPGSVTVNVTHETVPDGAAWISLAELLKRGSSDFPFFFLLLLLRGIISGDRLATFRQISASTVPY